MKKMLMFSAVVMMVSLGCGVVEAAEFQPTLLKISADEYIQHDYISLLEIPVNITGSPCTLFFSVFIDDQAHNIVNITSGYLGWHYVNKIDTCVYISAPYIFEIGKNSVFWDGRDNECRIVPKYYDYKYYMWAYDSKSHLKQVSEHMKTGPYLEYASSIQSVDEQGIPLASPIWYTATDRWIIGSDPSDATKKQVSTMNLADGWNWHGRTILQPDEFENVYVRVSNPDAGLGSIQKYRFVPGGETEMISDWGGEAPFADIFIAQSSESCGIATDGNYLYTIDSSTGKNKSDSNFYIYDMDGYMVEKINLSPWWSTEDKSFNGGPSAINQRNGYLTLSSHASCLVQMISPAEYLDTGELNDLIVWSNGNGDYFHDRNFETTAMNPWVCHDNSGETFYRNMTSDTENFSVQSIENNLLALFTPDGTGVGYLSVNVDKNSIINGLEIIDSNTPYDGMYLSTLAFGDLQNNVESNYWMQGELNFVGHDVVTGNINGWGDFWYTPRNYISIVGPPNGQIVPKNEIVGFWWLTDLSGDINSYISSDDGQSWELIKNLGEIGFETIVFDDVVCKVIIKLTIKGDRYEQDTLTLYVKPEEETTHFHLDYIKTTKFAFCNIQKESAFDHLGRLLTTGDEIGVYNCMGKCLGACVWKKGENHRLLISNRENVCDQSVIRPGETLLFRIWDSETGIESNAEAIIDGEIVTFKNGYTYNISHLSVPGTVSVDTETPMTHTLLPNRPNPFNPVTGIPFTLAGDSDIELSVYNITGEKVATLADGFYPSGNHSIEWNASGFASGIYFYRLRAGEIVETRKMTVLK